MLLNLKKYSFTIENFMMYKQIKVIDLKRFLKSQKVMLGGCVGTLVSSGFPASQK